MRQSLLGLALLGLALSLTACGGGEIQENEVRLGDVRSGTPTALRDGGEPVTGLVVRKGAGDKVLAETEYKDGFPEGVMREWYDGGQQKSELNVRLGTTPRGQDLVDVGTRRSWCENGTLREERDYDADGNPQGTHKMWTCGFPSAS